MSTGSGCKMDDNGQPTGTRLLGIRDRRISLETDWEGVESNCGTGIYHTARHRCELPGNYPVFTMVMVIYTFVRRISIITLPPDFF